MIRKLLIANRGEIACRVIRTAADLGIATVAVYSDADSGALHVQMADEAVRIGPAPVPESYLKGPAIILAALETDADAIHPGYGFLSENPEFVEAVEAAGLIFVGPSASAIRAMGLKDEAKSLMEKAGVPVVPGYHGANQDVDFLAAQADGIGYPVLIKARAGGGGKGMRLVETPKEFAEALAGAAREAEASFGDPRCLVEKYIRAPRHIEVQVFGDRHGNVVHLFERDCSLQRRHQKVIEEAPAPGMTEDLRTAMGEAAVAAAKVVNYEGAGTVELIVDGAAFPDENAFWFMEMNTRLQVEHPVTELVTGLDLVALQIAVAEGQALPVAQADVALNGHAVEARLYAEDAATGFLPATGRLEQLVFDGRARIDTGVAKGDLITSHYDPMLAKIIAHGPDRSSALRRLSRSLAATRIAGVTTNRDFLVRLAADPAFVEGDVETGLIARRGDDLTRTNPPEPVDLALAALVALGAADARTDTAIAGLTNFRHFGPARQTVVFDEAGPVAVETLGAEMVIDTPLGRCLCRDLHRMSDAISLTVDDLRLSAHWHQAGPRITIDRRGVARRFVLAEPGGSELPDSADAIAAPMSGRIVRVAAAERQSVAKGDALVVLEAMKMEHTLRAPRDGVVERLSVREGQQVDQGAILVELAEETA